MRYRIIFLSLLAATGLSAQWEPGDAYREYHYVTPADGEAFLRVGGRYGYAARGEQLLLPDSFDLGGAVRATVTLEKVLSHEDSRDLRISVNGHPPIPVPEPVDLPQPQTEYMYHTDLTVPVPLDQLRSGRGNRFDLSLDSVQRWGWPQNIFYAVTFRIYYPAEQPAVIDYPTDTVVAGSTLRLTGLRPGDRRADYILIGRDTDWSGRGVHHRKHWQTHRGEPLHILGSATDTTSGFAVRWDTEWLPEQPGGLAVQARVLGADGVYRVTAERAGLLLAERPYRIELYGGTSPRNWVTRSGEFEQTLLVADSVDRAVALQLNWVSWSPCYSNGVFLNGHLIWDRSPDCYVFATHQPVYTGLAVRYLERGLNTVSTALTPLIRGRMVHGMEVQWPGFQLKVRYGPGATVAH